MTSEELAWRIRRHGMEMTHKSHASHIASILSVADIVAVLYSGVMKVNPRNPRGPERDRFVLSKGHAGVAVYAALAELGFFKLEELNTYYSDGSRLSGHVSHKNIPGVELSTGSLGHGVCVACGMAMAAKLNEQPHHVWCIVGDGECNEGAVWETALFANRYLLDNFTVIVDCNGMQAMGFTKDVMPIDNLAEKWRCFGWDTADVDGHDHKQLRAAFCSQTKGKPRCIVAHTIKGKGISHMENNLLWHYRDPQAESYEQAVRELEEKHG
jgi:transketolase